MRSLSVSVVILALSLSACDRDGGKDPEELLAEDTTLAIDLARANDALDDGDPDTTGLGLTDDDPPITDASAEEERAVDPGVRPTNPSASRPAQRTVPPPAENTPVASAASPDVGSQPGCSSPAAADQRRCLLALLASYDVGLNREYGSLIQRMRREAGAEPGQADPGSVERLRAAQRSWLVYRDRECRRRTRSREGELWAPARARCLGQLSSERTRELGSL